MVRQAERRIVCIGEGHLGGVVNFIISRSLFVEDNKGCGWLVNVNSKVKNTMNINILNFKDESKHVNW